MAIDPTRITRKTDPATSIESIDVDRQETRRDAVCAAIEACGANGASIFDVAIAIGMGNRVQNMSTNFAQLREEGRIQLVPYLRPNPQTQRMVTVAMSSRLRLEQFQPLPDDEYRPDVLTKDARQQEQKRNEALVQERRTEAMELMASVCYCLKSGYAVTADKLVKVFDDLGVIPEDFISATDRAELDAAGRADAVPAAEVDQPEQAAGLGNR